MIGTSREYYRLFTNHRVAERANNIFNVVIAIGDLDKSHDIFKRKRILIYSTHLFTKFEYRGSKSIY